MALADRVSKLEKRMDENAAVRRPCHRVVWREGQAWDEAWRDVGEEYQPGDLIVIRRIVAAENGRPVRDPIHERDMRLAIGAGR